LAARLYGLTAKPFWMDEITTIHRAALPLGRMIRDALFFHQMPAFFVVTSWALPFGQGEGLVRLPALLFGALSCVLGFGVARSLGGTAAGLAAGLLLALSPAMVQYGQEARSYTMMICAILVALWGLAVLARDPAAASAPLRRGGRTGAWAAYTFGTVAALNVLSDALFWPLAANLAAIAIARQRTAQPRGFGRNWLMAQAVIVVLCVPWFVAIDMFGQRGAMGGLDWVQKLTFARLWWALAGTYFMDVTSLITVRIFPPGVPGFGFAVLVLAVAGLLYLRRHGAVLAAMAAAILVLPVCLIGISLIAPVLMPRYLLWSAAPFCVSAGLGMALLPRRLQAPAVAMIGLLGVLNLLPYYQDETKPRWDLAGVELRAAMQPPDLLLVNDPQAVQLMNLYLNRRAVPAITNWTLDPNRAAAWLAAGHRVWAVQGKVGQADHEDQAAFFKRIAILGRPAFEENAGLDIRIVRYDPAGPPRS
jgi:4-amino-4-deoxy-L-arabinose transferase-like glycosyltransferase